MKTDILLVDASSKPYLGKSTFVFKIVFTSICSILSKIPLLPKVISMITDSSTSLPKINQNKM